MADTLKKITVSLPPSASLIVDIAQDGLTNPEVSIAFPTTGIGGSLTPTSTPLASTKVWSDSGICLSGSPVTLDLTALARGNLPNITLSGLSVKFFMIHFRATNNPTALLTVKDGTTNGYLLFGDASGQVTLRPGQFAMIGYKNVTGAVELPVVGATVKTIDITNNDAALGDYDVFIAA